MKTLVNQPTQPDELAEARRIANEALDRAERLTEERDRRDREISKLRDLAACIYQFAGAHDAPEHWMDTLSAAANGNDFNTDKLLPYVNKSPLHEMPKPLVSDLTIESAILRCNITVDSFQTNCPSVIRDIARELQQWRQWAKGGR